MVDMRIISGKRNAKTLFIQENDDEMQTLGSSHDHVPPAGRCVCVCVSLDSLET